MNNNKLRNETGNFFVQKREKDFGFEFEFRGLSI